MVRDGAGGRLQTVALCPGMVIGARDRKPTSTSLLIAMARSPLAFLPSGGIPIVDARVAARRTAGRWSRVSSGRRYALVGRTSASSSWPTWSGGWRGDRNGPSPSPTPANGRWSGARGASTG